MSKYHDATRIVSESEKPRRDRVEIDELKMAADTRHQPTTDIRHPIYEIGDKIEELLNAVVNDSIMVDDRTLGSLLDFLQKTGDAVRKHLDVNYRWD